MEWIEIEGKISFSKKIDTRKLVSSLRKYMGEGGFCVPEKIGQAYNISSEKDLFFRDSYYQAIDKDLDFLRVRKRFHYYPFQWFSWFPLFKPHRIEIQEKGQYQWNKDGIYTATEKRTEVDENFILEKTVLQFELVQKRQRINLILKTPFAWGNNLDHIFIISLDRILSINNQFLPELQLEELEFQIDRNNFFTLEKLLEDPKVNETEKERLLAFKECVILDFTRIFKFIQKEFNGEIVLTNKFSQIRKFLDRTQKAQ